MQPPVDALAQLAAVAPEVEQDEVAVYMLSSILNRTTAEVELPADVMAVIDKLHLYNNCYLIQDLIGVGNSIIENSLGRGVSGMV